MVANGFIPVSSHLKEVVDYDPNYGIAKLLDELGVRYVMVKFGKYYEIGEPSGLENLILTRYLQKYPSEKILVPSPVKLEPHHPALIVDEGELVLRRASIINGIFYVTYKAGGNIDTRSVEILRAMLTQEGILPRIHGR